jgi:hypothetical protein
MQELNENKENKEEDESDDNESCSGSDEDGWRQESMKLGPKEKKATWKENKKKAKEEKRETCKTKIHKADKKKRKKMAKPAVVINQMTVNLTLVLRKTIGGRSRRSWVPRKRRPPEGNKRKVKEEKRETRKTNIHKVDKKKRMKMAKANCKR